MTAGADTFTYAYLANSDLLAAIAYPHDIASTRTYDDIQLRPPATPADYVGQDGNITAYVDSSDDVVYAADYSPFGEAFSESGTAPCAFGFSTIYRDAETGLLVYRFRPYDPARGVWPTKDLIGEMWGVNLYAMAGNDPVRGVDYWGLWKPTPESAGQARRSYWWEGPRDTIETLAQKVKLDPAESNKWAQKEVSVVAHDGKTHCAYSIPNTIYVSYGNLDSHFYVTQSFRINTGGYLGRVNDILMEFKQKYSNYYYVTKGPAAPPNEIRLDLKTNEDVIGWFHGSHGERGSLKLDDVKSTVRWCPVPFHTYFVVNEKTPQLYTSDQFEVHHKLSFIFLYSCQAAQGNWSNLLAPGGRLWA